MIKLKAHVGHEEEEAGWWIGKKLRGDKFEI